MMVGCCPEELTRPDASGAALFRVVSGVYDLPNKTPVASPRNAALGVRVFRVRGFEDGGKLWIFFQVGRAVALALDARPPRS
jgi:hypothetical protein